jgi:ribosomal protein S27E
MMRFQCPNCGMGDAEFGHLMNEDDVHCIVCLEVL